MSQLSITNGQTNWKMNVLQFNSPVYSEITSAQTKVMQMHFPIRLNQPEVQFSVIFSSENEFENFQRFVRAHQLQVASDPKTLLTLNWPERNITNWTGVIKSIQAGGKRFNFAPRCSFSVSLVDSMVAKRMNLVVDPGGILWKTIYGEGMGPDAVLSAPNDALNAYLLGLTGENDNGQVSAPNGQTIPPSNAGPTINPAQPGIGPGGIAAGH